MKKALLILTSILVFCQLRAQTIFLYKPFPMAVSADTAVTFEWKKRPDVSLYTLQVSADTFFTAPQEYTTPDAQFRVTGLAMFQKYWWRVKGDSGPWSQVRRFRTVDMHAWGGLCLWFRADSGITVQNGVVAQWNDQSDSNRTATQATAALRPEYIAKSFNDLPAVKFGKQGTAGQGTPLLFSPMVVPSGTFTALAVWKIHVNTISLQYLIGGSSQGIYAGGTFSGFTNSGSFDGVRNYGATGTNNLLLNQTSIKKNRVWRNGTVLAGTGTPIQSLSVNMLGSRTDLANLFLNATLPELLLFNTDLPDSTRIYAQTYLNSKYARPVKLPYDTVVCGPTVSLTLPGAADEYSAILWSTGSTAATATFTANGTYWVRGTSRLGGYITTDTVRVRGILPFPVLSPTAQQKICLYRDTISFINISANPAYSFVWSTGETADTIRVTAGNPVYLLAQDAATGCLLSSDTVEILNKVRADFDNTAACPNTPATFADLSVDLTGDPITGWAWNFGDPGTALDTSSQTNGVWTYANSGTYSLYLKVTASDGCSDSIAKPLTVKPTATSNFTWQGPCYGRPTQFFDASVPEAGTQVTGYQWTFGPGISSSFVNPAVTFDTANVYPVLLKVFTASGCTDTVTLQVPVNKGVNAAFTIPDSLCARQTVPVLDESQGVNDNITQWVWRFGNNTPIGGQAPVFAFQGTGSRVVRLTTTTTAGCADSVQKTVFVRPTPTAAFSFAVNGGTPPFTPTVNNLSTGATAYAWDYGNGFTDFGTEPVLPTFGDTGTYTVTLAVSNVEGCTDTATHDFVVFTGDRTLQLMDATCVTDGDYVTYTARVLNKGGLEVTDITFGANLDYNSVLREKWQGNLFSGQVMEYVFNSSAKYFTDADFCCVRIESFNDTLTVQAPDNEICRALTDNAWFSAAYPTPCTGIVTIDHTLPFADKLTATLCSVDGKVLRTLFANQSMPAGFGNSTADITDLRAGLYVIRFTYRDENYSVKVLKR